MKLQIFNNKEFGEIRTASINNEPYVMLNDICKALDIKNVSDTKSRLSKDGVDTTEVIDSIGRKQQATFINESNLYRVIFQSRKKEAGRFTEWVTTEVLPSIRKHGMYAKDELLDNPDLLLDVVKKYKEEREQKLSLQKQIETDRPKVLFAKAVENSEDVILVKEMALILTQHGFKIGQNQLYEYFRKHEYLCKKVGYMYNLPTKRYEHFFKVTKRTIQHTNRISVTNTPKVTGKGQMYFIKKFSEYKLAGLTVKDLLAEHSFAN